jgi:hypothetical protein
MYYDIPSRFPSICFEHPVVFLGLSDSSVDRMMFLPCHKNGTALLLCPVCNTVKGNDRIIVLLLSSVQYVQMDVIHCFTDKQDLWLLQVILAQSIAIFSGPVATPSTQAEYSELDTTVEVSCPIGGCLSHQRCRTQDGDQVSTVRSLDEGPL